MIDVRTAAYTARGLTTVVSAAGALDGDAFAVCLSRLALETAARFAIGSLSCVASRSLHSWAFSGISNGTRP